MSPSTISSVPTVQPTYYPTVRPTAEPTENGNEIAAESTIDGEANGGSAVNANAEGDASFFGDVVVSQWWFWMMALFAVTIIVVVVIIRCSCKRKEKEDLMMSTTEIVVNAESKRQSQREGPWSTNNIQLPSTRNLPELPPETESMSLAHSDGMEGAVSYQGGNGDTAGLRMSISMSLEEDAVETPRHTAGALVVAMAPTKGGNVVHVAAVPSADDMDSRISALYVQGSGQQTAGLVVAEKETEFL